MSVAEPHVQSILLGDAIEHAPAAVLVTDDEGRYVAVNAYACAMLGYERPELLGMSITDVARDPDARHEFDELLQARSLNGTSAVQRKDGSTLRFGYRAGETQIAGMTYYVAVGWPDE
jgi:PAS domain S-box-containing protein